MAIAANPITHNSIARDGVTRDKGLLSLLRQTVPPKERAVELYRRLLDINNLSSELSSVQDISGLKDHLAGYFQACLPNEDIRLCLIQDLHYRRLRLSGSAVDKEEILVPVSRDIPGSVLKTGSPLWIPDMQTSGKIRKCYTNGRGSHPQSLLVLPFSAMGKVQGCLEMVSSRPNCFDEIEYNLGSIVVKHLSSSLENILTRQELAAANARLLKNDLHLTQLNKKLQQLAHTDEATGLHNRRRLLEQLDMEIARARRYGEVFSCFMIDIDDFKKINDMYGHQAGDETLRQTGALLRRSLRRSDFISRYGGEEFTVLLPRTNGSGAYRAAENLRSNFMAQHFTLPDATVRITISIGITTCTSFDRLDAQEIIQNADNALYRAKRAGKNRVCLYEENASSSEKVRILSNV
jgi:diguanylate cyclase (GGDEF)-like protein